jgi:hypothetical protein
MSESAHPPRSSPARLKPWQLLAMLAVLLYLGLALYQLNLPGLHYDEALDAAPAVQTVLGVRIDGAHTAEVAGHRWPLMVLQWMGATTTYLMIAAFGIFGIGAATLRATGVLIGLISLLLAWGFLRDYLDERAAGLSILLLAVSPGFVFWSRMIALVHLPLLPIGIATVWLLFRWYTLRQGHYLVMAAFGLGFGLQTHVIFLIVWAGLGLAWLLLSPWLGSGTGSRRWLWPWQISGTRTWILSGLALLLGASPLLMYNLQQTETIRYAMERLATGEAGRFRTLGGLAHAVGISLRNLGVLLDGEWFATRLGGLHRNPLAPLAFGLAAALVAWLAVRHRLSYSVKRVAFFAILILTIAFLQTIAEGSDGVYHLLVLWPMPQALVAVALVSLADRLRGSLQPIHSVWKKRSGVVHGALSLLAVLLVGAEAWTSIGYHRALAQTGGVGYFSDAIYSLARDLERAGGPQPIAMDWGFRRNLQVLTQNQVDPPEWFTYSDPPDPAFGGYVRELIGRFPNALYLFHAPEYTAFPGHLEVFEQEAYHKHLEPLLSKTYVQRDGKSVYQVYTLTPAPRLFDPPGIEHRLDVQLGDRLALLGYDMAQDRLHPGENIELTLYWKALASQERNYKVFVHLFDDSGTVWGQHDDLPVYGSYPMTEWQTGEIVPDRITIEPAAGIPSGAYHVFVGMYDEATGERLPLFLDGRRLKGDTLGLAEIRVDSSEGGSG